MQADDVAGTLYGLIWQHFCSERHYKLGKVTLPSSLKDSTSFSADLKADEFDLPELGVELWDTFSVEPTLTEGVKTVGELLARVQRQVAELPRFLVGTFEQRNVAHG